MLRKQRVIALDEPCSKPVEAATPTVCMRFVTHAIVFQAESTLGRQISVRQ